jgi:predicted DNA-binding transcriptional regulator AlpA
MFVSGSHDPVLRIPEAAKYLGLSESGLKKLRLAGSGPVFVKLTASAVGYRLSALNAYLDTRSRRSTSDTGQAA